MPPRSSRLEGPGLRKSVRGADWETWGYTQSPLRHRGHTGLIHQHFEETKLCMILLGSRFTFLINCFDFNFTKSFRKETFINKKKINKLFLITKCFEETFWKCNIKCLHFPKKEFRYIFMSCISATLPVNMRLK